mmetsp:Transcript_123675/g.357770  ORF Transcript_123675/g.357770 Transcript_123675/m.357770 type:complete len:249 (+) Transcript_123675:86-832(+)
MASTGKKLCVGYCVCCCCVILAIVLFVVIVAATFETPTVDVDKVQVANMKVSPTAVTMFVNITIHIANPNNWPIEGSVETLLAKIYSLDKDASDGMGSKYYMGDATLPSPVPIETQSNTSFVVVAAVEVPYSAETAALIERINGDCGVLQQLGGAATTKLQIVLASVEATVAGVDVDAAFDIPFATEVPCQQGGGDGATAAPGSGGGAAATTAAPGTAAPGTTAPGTTAAPGTTGAGGLLGGLSGGLV